MRDPLRELLFDDHQREAAESTRESMVRPAPRSHAAKQKDNCKQTHDGLPIQSFQCLLKDLSTLCKNKVRCNSIEFDQLTLATQLQRHVFTLLDLSLRP